MKTENNDNALDILKQLIVIDSSNSEGECECAAKIKDIFASVGVCANIDRWAHRRVNVEVRIKGISDKPAIMFASHIDVVPADAEKWQNPPFAALQRQGKLFGRGAADMKGGMAAVMGAISQLLKQGRVFDRSLIFVATCAEETNSEGAMRYLSQNPDLKGNIAGIIVPEPTSMNLATAHKGILWLKITFHGKPSHGSMPQLGVNAIENALLLHKKITDLELDKNGDDFLGNCSISCNKITGGKATNIIPDSCETEYDIRICGGMEEQEIISRIQHLIELLKAEKSSFDASIELLRRCPMLNTDKNNWFVRRIAEICDKKPVAVGYTTDSPFFARFNAPVIVMGPAEPQMCHKIDEYVDIDELIKAQLKYQKIISHFCIK